MPSNIIVKGAKIHNLKNVDVEIPRNKLTVITGLSGSGKSSLAFDTIYAEGQRRYVESLSTYARQFLQLMEKPDVESIEGLSPAISIDQKTTSRNPRSTVGTVTEIYDYLRLLFARVGKPHCSKCGKLIKRQSASNIVNHVASMLEGKRILLLAPMVRDRKGKHEKIFERIQKEGFVRVRVDGEVMSILEVPALDENKRHSIEIVVDRLVIKDLEIKFETLKSGEKLMIPNSSRSRLADSVEMALKFGEGIMMIMDHETGEQVVFSENFACEECGISLPEIEPRSFSFNSPHGACEACHGLGTRLEIDADLVIPNRKLTLSEGAIMPWASTTSHLDWYNRILKTVSKIHGFSMDVPVEELAEAAVRLVLYGTGDREYEVHWDRGYTTKYEGVIPNLERRYLETDSDYVRTKIEQYMRILDCPVCLGKRLKKEILGITIEGRSIAAVSALSIEKAYEFFNNLQLTETEKQIAEPILREIRQRLMFLNNVGISYLTLERAANTLSGGEAQRIRLATQIGSRLLGVLYVLDEPTIGLHQNDNEKLIKALLALRDIGNTVIVVEHDVDVMLASDYIIDVGPGAGKYGGTIIASGTPEEIMNDPKSLTGQYLSGKKEITIPKKRKQGNGTFLKIIEAEEHNLKKISVDIPLECFVGITGVSGSGKSTLINDILVKTVSAKLNRTKVVAGKHKAILGIEYLDKLINIDQAPIGRTPRSNPATYTKVFTDIRDLFAGLPESKVRGYTSGRFSFNVKGGRCEACQGDGMKKIEMHFLPDIYVACEECKGLRYNREALEITYRGKTIADVLGMTVDEALDFFTNIPVIKVKLQTLAAVGLGYIHLGQSATTLSGGEAQRIKLSTELSKRATGRTLYVLDEPTTGLHFDDVKKLLSVLQELVNKGNTVLVIEHNLDVIKFVDYVIDMGMGGGEAGGMVVAIGTPEQLAKNEQSYTGKWLRKIGL
ncbi:TPA: excinuclease ABC subunit UvrA [Candidatus Peregrinibacteria bacterium]|nr:excinuclease ABC subunit UvrA [Candidatus Peregrinibacteria bacterium]